MQRNETYAAGAIAHRLPRAAGVAALVLLLAVPTGSALAAGAFKAKNCVDCHQETIKQTPTKNAHEPFGARNCEGCHRRHGVIGKLVLQGTGRELCLPCHETFADVTRRNVVHEPLKQGDCSGCHLSLIHI